MDEELPRKLRENEVGGIHIDNGCTLGWACGMNDA
jgi:hypothetical protein